MTLRETIRPCVLGLTVFAAGCSTLESIEAAVQDTPFTVKPAAAMAMAPTFRVGDVFRFRVGGNTIAETVERIDAKGVWWRDSLGRRWIGGGGVLIPTRAVLKSGDTFKIADSTLESTGELFPLKTGASVAYRYTARDGNNAARAHERSCAVGAFGSVVTAAGAFDAYRLKCVHDGSIRNNYYAPALGRVVLQTSDTFFGSIKRELVSYERGPAEELRMAKGGSAMALAPATKPAALAGGTRFGVQLAAYRSPSRAKQAWLRIRRNGGALLDGQSPTIERHDGAGGPLFRLIVGSYATKNKARAYCRTLRRGGIDCWPRAHRAAVKPAVVAGTALSPTDLRVVRR